MIGSTWRVQSREFSKNGAGVRDFRSRRSPRSAAQRFLRGPLQADRGLRPRRHLRLSLRRAPFDAARHGAVAERVSRRDRPAHQAAALRPAGLHARALPSAAAGGRDLHARPDEPRPLPARHRQGHLADRGRLLRRRLQERRQDVRRVVRHHHAGADEEDGGFRGRVLPLQERAVRGRSRSRSRIRRCGTAWSIPTAPSARRRPA